MQGCSTNIGDEVINREFIVVGDGCVAVDWWYANQREEGGWRRVKVWVGWKVECSEEKLRVCDGSISVWLGTCLVYEVHVGKVLL